MIFYYESSCQGMKCLASVALVSGLNATAILQGVSVQCVAARPFALTAFWEQSFVKYASNRFSERPRLED